jgi:uncharacterized protein YndB with AHSA1/START domain
MTTQRTFKRRVRERMAKTGESYTAARRMLIAAGEPPPVAVAVAYEPTVSEASVARATGRGWQAWFDLLDAWGAVARPHPEIARFIADEHGVDGWWSQSITVTYERARGLRVPGQRPDGFRLTASKTLPVPAEAAFAAFEDAALRDAWLPAGSLRRRTATPPRTARYDWEDGSTRVNVGVTPAAAGRSRIALSHERLPDAETADEMKAWWRERLDALATLLAGGGHTAV